MKILFLCKKVRIVPEFEMLGRLGWFGRREKKKKKILSRSLTALNITAFKNRYAQKASI
jgi:hypothetical protein